MTIDPNFKLCPGQMFGLLVLNDVNQFDYLIWEKNISEIILFSQYSQIKYILNLKNWHYTQRAKMNIKITSIKLGSECKIFATVVKTYNLALFKLWDTT